MTVPVQGNVVEVTLGEHTIPVYAQRWRYAVNKLGGVVGSFTASGQDVTAENFAVFAGDRVYEVLCALIPGLAKRMPEWEFNGYASAEAAVRSAQDPAADEYDPETGREPTFEQIIGAMETAWRVNRLDVLGGLKAIVDPTMLRAQVNALIATRIDDGDPAISSVTPGASPISPSTNGTSGSTSSTPSSPMSTVSTD
jgi:hypothetical protein